MYSNFTHTHIQYIAYTYKNTFVSRNSMEPMNYMKPQVCMHTHTHTHTHVYTHNVTHLHTHNHTHAHTYTHILTHTHTHTCDTL